MLKKIFKGLFILFIFYISLIFPAIPSLAFIARSGQAVTIAAGEIVDEDLYVAGGSIIIDGTINGDLFACGQSISINGDVKGGILAVAEIVNINGYVGRTARIACRTFNANGDIDRDLIVGAVDLKITKKARINGDLLVGAGNMDIDGIIGSDILGGAGEVTIANGVKGNVHLKVRKLILLPAANIEGDLTYQSIEKASIQSNARVAGAINHEIPKLKGKQAHLIGLFLKIIAKAIGFIMALITGFVIILVAPKRLTSISECIGNNPWSSLGWGFVILVATPFVAMILFFTIVGIPVGLIAMAFYLIAIYLSAIPVGSWIGQWFIGHFIQIESKAIMAGALALGLFILALLKLIPFVGLFISLVIILLGLGAIVVSEKKQWMISKGLRSPLG